MLVEFVVVLEHGFLACCCIFPEAYVVVSFSVDVPRVDDVGDVKKFSAAPDGEEVRELADERVVREFRVFQDADPREAAHGALCLFHGFSGLYVCVAQRVFGL